MNKTSSIIIENSIIVGLSSYFDLSVVQSFTCLTILCNYNLSLCNATHNKEKEKNNKGKRSDIVA